ncbi:hybrid signal transduction histidine kinase A-like isoform X2 [Teleopsis dalmanni]|nr:hybrid signal transduction histidine kinase A-like isoform X2 [Teleopsis dalmanni]
MKMEKTPRYTQRERNMVLGFAAQYKDVIENKRTDAESNRKKDEVWRQIAKEFNARVYHQRSSKQLRQLYKNMKLLLKKDLCGEGKGNRSFMDLLNTLSQQESVAQYISEQMSPEGFNSRPQKFDDDFDDTKFPGNLGGMDTDVIVIKSEDISDNEQSQSGLNHDMDDDDDDCLSTKDIPEVCLEEEDDEIFATDLRQTLQQHNIRRESQSNAQSQNNQQQKPEVTIQNVGGIRVGSIGSMANMKALENGSNSLSITRTNSSSNTNNNNSVNTQTSSEQAAQRLLLNGLGLSAVQSPPQMPTLQRNHNLTNGNSNLLLGLSNNNNYIGTTSKNTLLNNGNSSSILNNNSYNSSTNNNHNSNSNNNHNNNRNNDYLMSLAIEERKRKIDLLNAQIDYWKTLTKKLDSNTGHTPNPSCICHFPGNVNGMQSSSS